MKIVIKNNILGIEHEGKFTPAEGLIGHVAPDIDLLTAIWLLKHFGIETGRMVFKSAKEGLVEDKTPSQWLKEGWILVDVGGESEKCTPDNLTHLDHDHFLGNGRCSTSIVFELICSSMDVNQGEKEKLEKLVRFVTSTDLKGGQQFFDLSHMCKILNLKVTPEKLYKRISMALTVYLESLDSKPNKKLLMDLFNEIIKERRIDYRQVGGPMKKYFDRVSKDKAGNIPDLLRITDEKTRSLVRAILKEEIDKQVNFQKDSFEVGEALLGHKSPMRIYWLNKTRKKFMVTAHTDSTEFHKAALNKGASIVAKQNSKGQIQIFTQKRDRVNIAKIAGRIRSEEFKIRNGEEFPLNPEILLTDGTIDEVPNYHLFIQGGMFLNGSFTAEDQEPTILSLDRTAELIVEEYN